MEKTSYMLTLEFQKAQRKECYVTYNDCYYDKYLYIAVIKQKNKGLSKFINNNRTQIEFEIEIEEHLTDIVNVTQILNQGTLSHKTFEVNNKLVKGSVEASDLYSNETVFLEIRFYTKKADSIDFNIKFKIKDKELKINSSSYYPIVVFSYSVQQIFLYFIYIVAFSTLFLFSMICFRNKCLKRRETTHIMIEGLNKENRKDSAGYAILSESVV